MSLENIINSAKVEKEEMSSISFNIPSRLKEQLVKLTKENDITVNAFLVATVDSVLNGDLKDKTTLELVEKLETLRARKAELEKLHVDTGGDRFVTFKDGTEMDLETELNQTDFMIRLLIRNAK